jgi:hypothetical protein
MATVKIDTFGGIAPRQHPTLLADGMAVTAHNCRLKTGKLVPLREPQLVEGPNILMENGLADIADAESMHVWRRADGAFDFILFPGVTWSAPGNIAADDLTRIVVSGETGVSFVEPDGDSGTKTTLNTPVVYMRDPETGKVIYPIAKNPIGYPVVSRTDGPIDPTEANIRYTRFFFTWVDKYGMESPVSEPSRNAGTPPVDDDLQYLDGDSIQFAKPTNLPPLYVAIRVYKVVAGAQEGRVQFVYEISKTQIETLSADYFSFTVKDEDAGEIMPEIEAPPADLSCIHDVPGAFYCGFSPSMPKTVCFSDVDLLYSWPVAYRYDVADNLVALAVTSNSVFALTEGWPYVLSGTAPESMSVAKLAGPAACVSPRGVCVYRNAVYFVSNQGLMAIFNSADAGTVCQNLTDKIFTKDQWLALNPSSCVMGQHDGALFLYFTLADGTHKGLTIDLMDDMKIAVTTHDEAATCLCVDVKEDKMYFVREGV